MPVRTHARDGWANHPTSSPAATRVANCRDRLSSRDISIVSTRHASGTTARRSTSSSPISGRRTVELLADGSAESLLLRSNTSQCHRVPWSGNRLQPVRDVSGMEMLEHGIGARIAEGMGIDPYAVRSMIRLAEASSPVAMAPYPPTKRGRRGRSCDLTAAVRGWWRRSSSGRRSRCRRARWRSRMCRSDRSAPWAVSPTRPDTRASCGCHRSTGWRSSRPRSRRTSRRSMESRSSTSPAARSCGRSAAASTTST